MFKSQIKLDAGVQNEINGKFKSVCIALIVIGSLGLLGYILVSTFVEPEPVWNSFLLLFAIPLGIGLVYFVVISKTNKKSLDGERLFNYEFNEDSFLFIEEKNGEKVLETKIYYKDLFKVKQTKNYLLLYTSNTSVVPVKKSDFSAENFQTLLNFISSARKK